MAVNEDVNTDHIVIEFKYKILGSDDWFINDIAVEEYFDFSMLDEGEELESDSVPMFNNLIDYFNDEHQQISQIFISITDKKNNEKIQFSQLFWNGQNCWILERIDTTNGIRNYHEYIIETLLPAEITKNPEKSYEIIRFSPEKEGIKCWYHGIINDNADGSQSEIIIDPERFS